MRAMPSHPTHNIPMEAESPASAVLANGTSGKGSQESTRRPNLRGARWCHEILPAIYEDGPFRDGYLNK